MKGEGSGMGIGYKFLKYHHAREPNARLSDNVEGNATKNGERRTDNGTIKERKKKIIIMPIQSSRI